MGLIERITGILRGKFQGCSVDLEFVNQQRVFGTMVWSGFEGMEQIERQRQMWHELDRQLQPAEQANISAILTLTPDEIAVPR